MLAVVQAGETQALVLPTVMAEYTVNPRCDLQVVGKEFAVVSCTATRSSTLLKCTSCLEAKACLVCSPVSVFEW